MSGIRMPRQMVIASLCATMCFCASAQSFDLQAHRGGRGLSPENTLAAFNHAMRLGVTTLEMDVSLTADDVLVVSHDTRLNPAHTRDAQGAWLSAAGPAIRTLTFDQLQRYDVGRIDPASAYGRQFARQEGVEGERIPTLAAVFDWARSLGSTVRFNIETKTDPARPDESGPPEAVVRSLLAEIARAGMASRVTVQSFDWRTLALVKAQAPQLPRSYLTAQRPSFDTLKDGRFTAPLKVGDFASVPLMVRAAAGDGGLVIWSPNYRDLTEALVREAHGLDLRVIPWTVNQTADMARLIDWQVDGLITDYPDQLRALMSERSMPLPSRAEP